MGTVVKYSVFLIGFWFFQHKVFHWYVLQVYFAAVLSITKIQGVSVLGNEQTFLFSFGPRHKAAEQSARISAHVFPVILKERVFWGDVL